jgi:hypothetical protein
MKVKEYLKSHDWNEISFIIAKAVKDEATPYYHAEYKTSSLLHPYDDFINFYDDYLILNDNAFPIDWLSGATWGNAVKRGYAKCLLIISWKDLTALYSEEQARETIEYIDTKIK